MDDRRYLRKKNLLRKSLYPKGLRKSRQLYSIGDMVRCRVRSTARRGSDLIIGVVVGRRKVFGTMSDYTYSVQLPEVCLERPALESLSLLEPFVHNELASPYDIAGWKIVQQFCWFCAAFVLCWSCFQIVYIKNTQEGATKCLST